MDTNAIKVTIWGMTVGYLSWDKQSGCASFEYEPAQPLGDDTSFTVDVRRLYEFSKQVLNEQTSVVLSRENSILWQDLIKISSSPGGKRPKAIVAINRETGDVISGQGSVPDGYEHFILKYDDDSVYPYAKLEYIYYRMATAAGIAVMPSELRSYGNISHFLTRRFDRCGNERIHTQTLAAMSPASSSYEDVFAVIRQLNLPYEDVRQQFLRMVFNVVARNVDDHSKNFAFCMTPDGQWRLSPAYDLTFSIDLAAPSYANRHLLTVNGKDEDITRADLIATAENNDIKDCNTLIEDVINAVIQFEKFAVELDIDPSLISKIKEIFNILK